MDPDALVESFFVAHRWDLAEYRRMAAAFPEERIEPLNAEAPGAPFGGFYVREWLRFGNSVIQLSNLAAICRKYQVPAVFYEEEHPFFDVARLSQMLGTRFQRRARRELTVDDGVLLADWFLYDGIYDPFTGQGRRQTIEDCLTPLLPAAFTSGHPMVDGDTLTVHFRAGDCFEFTPPANLVVRIYGQPPLAYYQFALERSPARRVVIVYEDTGNPTVEAFAAHARAAGREVVLQSSSLVSDLAVLFNSTQLVCSNSTFTWAVCSLSSRIRKFWCFEWNYDAGVFTRPEVAGNWVHDAGGGYYDAIMSANWAKNPEQLRLMLDYPASALSVETGEAALAGARAAEARVYDSLRQEWSFPKARTLPVPCGPVPTQSTRELLATLAARRETAALLTAQRRVIEELGVCDGFACYRSALPHLRDHGEIRWKPLASLYEVSRAWAAVFVETAAGEPFSLPAPELVGEGERRPLAGRPRAMFVASLGEARVRARSGVVEFDELALLDREIEEFTAFDDRLDFDASIFAMAADGAWIIEPPGNAASIELEEAFTLLGVRPQVFGHWMCEHLPRYVAATMTGSLPPVPLLVEAGMPKTHYQALRAMMPEPVPIIALHPLATARVRRLWCAPNQALFPVWEVQNERLRWDDVMLPPACYAAIIEEMARRVGRTGDAPTGSERIFLARRSANHRLVNAKAIEAVAEQAGFRLVYPEDLDFLEQVRVVRHARFVVGQSGSALYLTFFCKPGTKLCVLTFAGAVLPDRTSLSAMAATGIEISIISGPGCGAPSEDPVQADFAIDPDTFGRFLGDWLRR